MIQLSCTAVLNYPIVSKSEILQTQTITLSRNIELISLANKSNRNLAMFIKVEICVSLLMKTDV